MIPIEAFSAEPVAKPRRPSDVELPDWLRKSAHNAIKKALSDRPVVRKLLDLPLFESERRLYYSVKGHKSQNEYMVTLRSDRDGQWFIECSCPAMNPFADENTGVIKWQPKICYHSASALLAFTKTVKALEANRRKFAVKPE